MDEEPEGGMTRADWIRVVCWLACWGVGFWLLEYARFDHHNPLGALAYLVGVVCLCERSKPNGTSARPEE